MRIEHRVLYAGGPVKAEILNEHSHFFADGKSIPVLAVKLTDKDGNPVLFTSMTYSHGVMETVNEGRHIYFYNLREIPPDLEDAGRRLLQAFDVNERFFHFEFFRTHDDGRLIALEVNMRPPGGPIVDIFNYAHDVDLYWEWANVVVNNRFNASYSRKYHVCYISRKHSKTYAHADDAIMAAFGHCIIHQMAMPSVFSLTCLKASRGPS